MGDDQRRFRDALRETAESSEIPAAVDWRSRVADRRARRRRIRLTAVGGVLAVAALVGGVVVAQTGRSDRLLTPADSTATTTPGPTTAPSPIPTTPEPVPPSLPSEIAPGLAPPEWRTLPDPPLSPRQQPATAWTGTEYIVWGGLSIHTDGAAYDPGTDSWRVIAQGPLAPRGEAITVWTGSKLIVWGGVSATGTGALAVLDDGAMYDPAADTWIPMAPSPGGGRSRTGAAFAWTGSEMLVWGGGANSNEGLAYDPVANTWRTLPAAPIEWRSQPAGVWTGTEMVVWGGAHYGDDGSFERNDGDGAAYDPAADTWRVLPAGPMQPAIVDAVWTGTLIVFSAGFSGDPGGLIEAEATGGTYDPAADAWSPATWTGAHPGTELLAAGMFVVGFAKGGGWIHWSDTSATADLGVGNGDGTTAVWTGDQALMLSLDGAHLVGLTLPISPSPTEPTTCAASVPADGWTFTPLPQAIDRANPAAVWTGSAYVVWGGESGGSVLGTGYAFDPATQAIRTPPPAPIEARTSAVGVWTGTEMLVLGGSTTVEHLGPRPTDAAAYDPATDTWRTIAAPAGTVRSGTEPPLASDTFASPVWSGSALYVLATRPAGGTATSPGFVYDPASGTTLPLPVAPYEQARSAPVSTGSEIVVLGRVEGRDATIAYVPAAAGAPADRSGTAGGAWRVLGDVPRQLTASASIWTGTEVLFAGGGDSTPTSFGTAAFDPATGAWRELPGTPYHPGAELLPLGEDRIAVAIKGGYQVLDAATGELSERIDPGALLRYGSGRSTGTGAVFLADAADGSCDYQPVLAVYQP